MGDAISGSNNLFNSNSVMNAIKSGMAAYADLQKSLPQSQMTPLFQQSSLIAPTGGQLCQNVLSNVGGGAQDSVSSQLLRLNPAPAAQTGAAAPVQQTQTAAPAVSQPAAAQNKPSGDDGVSLSGAAAKLVDSGKTTKVLSADSPYQVGGAGVQTDGDMSLAEMKVALADARGVDVSDILVLSGSNQGDNINVTAGKNGGINIDVNGTKYELTSDQAQRLIIDGGYGNDNIVIDEAVKNDLVIMGGAGDDTIQGGSGNDTIVGGQGNDTLKGGKGNDRITDDAGFNKIYGEAGSDVLVAHSDAVDSSGKHLYANQIFGGAGRDYLEGGNAADYLSGGDGYDVLYGLGGNDVLKGGAGKDYIDGGEGNDSLFGDEGNDDLVGGVGSDALYGGAGKDLLVGGKGSDAIYGGDGDDNIITSGADDSLADKADGDKVTTVGNMNIANNFSITGDQYETARIKSDLEFLSSIANGQKLFSEIAKTGHAVTIDTSNKGNSCGSYAGLNSDPTRGSDSFVHYNLSKIAIDSGTATWGLRAPVIGMFHELCHSYNAAIGNMDQNYYDQTTGKIVSGLTANSAKGLEWQAVGLQNSNIANNPDLLTENGLRGLLGFEQRTRY